MTLLQINMLYPVFSFPLPVDNNVIILLLQHAEISDKQPTPKQPDFAQSVSENA